MNRIVRKFAELRQRSEKALITFVTAGYPAPAATPAVLEALVEGGADIIELGLPFSDPTADGPAIQRSSQIALQAGMTTAGVFALAAAFRRRHEHPLVLMGYYNTVFVQGGREFCRRAAEAGVDGLLLVDLPPEEAGELLPETAAAGLELIRLATPTASPERLKAICRGAGGFLYFVTLTGVTGAALETGEELAALLARAKNISPLPVVAGFGIAAPPQAAEVARHCDGVVVGSALVKLLDPAGKSLDAALPAVRRFTSELKEAVKSV